MDPLEPARDEQPASSGHSIDLSARINRTRALGRAMAEPIRLTSEAIRRAPMPENQEPEPENIRVNDPQFLTPIGLLDTSRLMVARTLFQQGARVFIVGAYGAECTRRIVSTLVSAHHVFYDESQPGGAVASHPSVANLAEKRLLRRHSPQVAVANGIDTVGAALTQLTAHPVPGFTDASSLLRAIRNSSVINDFAALIPLSVLDPMGLCGYLFPPPLLIRTADGGVELAPSFHRFLEGEHRAYMFDVRHPDRQQLHRIHHDLAGARCPALRRVKQPSSVELAHKPTKPPSSIEVLADAIIDQVLATLARDGVGLSKVDDPAEYMRPQGSRMPGLTTPSASSIVIDTDTPHSGIPAPMRGVRSSQAEAARALGELPSDSLLAIGFESAAPALAQYGRAMSILGRSGAQSPGISAKGLLAATAAPVIAMSEASTSARRDFQSWMGEGAVFVSGKGPIDLKAGLVIGSKNPSASRAAVEKLGAKLLSSGASVRPASIPGTDAAVSANLPGLPVAVMIANSRDANGQSKFVIGIGEASIRASLSPSATLSATSLYGEGTSQSGEVQPTLIAQAPTLLALLEGAGMSEDPAIVSVMPILHSLGTVVVGDKNDLRPLLSHLVGDAIMSI